MKKIAISTITILLFVIQANAQLSCQWAYIPQGISVYTNAVYTTTDVNGNIVQVGRVVGRADMDPAPGIADTSFSAFGYNYFVSKTNLNGQLMWIKYFKLYPGSATIFDFRGVEVNSNNEIIIGGNFFGLVDFDLSLTGVDTLRSHFPTYEDYFLAKYDSLGNKMWVFNIGNGTTSNIKIQDLSVQSNTDIVITASPSGSSPSDVDPGSGVHYSIGGNANIISYDNAGNYLWNNNIATTYSYALTNGSKIIAGDGAGNTYLNSVGYYELTVNKFNNAGARVWNKKIGNFSTSARVNPLSILVDKNSGAFYVAGTFGGTVDFDPGIVTVNRSSSSGFYQDAFIAKYDSSMNLIWVNAYLGPTEFGKNCLDFSGNDIIAVGKLQGTIDFGNGIILSSPSNSKPFYVKLNDAGVVSNAYLLNGAGAYNSIHSTSNQSYFVAGYITTATDMDPTPATLTLTPSTATHFISVHGIMPPLVSTLDLTLYFQGYYAGAGSMHSVLLNQGQSTNANITDSVTIDLRNSFSPYVSVRTTKAVLNTNGLMHCEFAPAITGSYYIVVTHRNGVETWSANPITIGGISPAYNFSTAASQAFGNSMVEMELGKWAIYTGDLNHDQNADLLDLSILETDINLFLFGYFATDINGDGNVDLLDYTIVETNVNNFIFSNHP